MRVFADLHTHSLVSDGHLSPAELVAHASSRGIHAVALTDHDTLAGIPPAQRISKEHGIRLIPGIEISAEFEPGMLHILGYFPSYPQGLEEELGRIQQARRTRVPEIIRRLNSLGIMLSEADVLHGTTSTQPGRPHIAKALVRKGYVRTIDEAFDEYLGTGGKAYVSKEKMTWAETIGTIIDHGGMPVLAHPSSLELEEEDLRAFVGQLSSAGLGGIEIHYPGHTAGHISLYTDIAREMNLVKTGGSDYHGPDRNGFSVGDFGIDESQFEVFCRRLTM